MHSKFQIGFIEVLAVGIGPGSNFWARLGFATLKFRCSSLEDRNPVYVNSQNDSLVAMVTPICLSEHRGE